MRKCNIFVMFLLSFCLYIRVMWAIRSPIQWKFIYNFRGIAMKRLVIIPAPCSIWIRATSYFPYLIQFCAMSLNNNIYFKHPRVSENGTRSAKMAFCYIQNVFSHWIRPCLVIDKSTIYLYFIVGVFSLKQRVFHNYACVMYMANDKSHN